MKIAMIKPNYHLAVLFIAVMAFLLCAWPISGKTALGSSNVSEIGVLENTVSKSLTALGKSIAYRSRALGNSNVPEGGAGGSNGANNLNISVNQTFDNVTDFNRAANNPSPSSEYRFGDSVWRTDSQGRVSEASGTVNLNALNGRSGTDGVSTTTIGREGVDGDIGFHLIGDAFGGPTNRLNVVPGNGIRVDPDGPPNLNQGAFGSFERLVRDAAKDPANSGQPIEIRVIPEYRASNTTNRPDQFEGSFRVGDGEWQSFIFRNRQGG